MKRAEAVAAINAVGVDLVQSANGHGALRLAGEAVFELARNANYRRQFNVIRSEDPNTGLPTVAWQRQITHRRHGLVVTPWGGGNFVMYDSRMPTESLPGQTTGYRFGLNGLVRVIPPTTAEIPGQLPDPTQLAANFIADPGRDLYDRRDAIGPFARGIKSILQPPRG